jgi:SpoVK/Ycf46/Vps4 family AAA+-type ATPase
MKYYFIHLGRLDQLINIPLPDAESSMAILEVSLRKSSVVNVDMNYLVNVTEGFSSGNLNKICQLAIIFAKKDLIKIEQIIMDCNEQEPLLLIERKHLQNAMTFIGCFKSSKDEFINQRQVTNADTGRI